MIQAWQPFYKDQLSSLNACHDNDQLWGTISVSPNNCWSTQLHTACHIPSSRRAALRRRLQCWWPDNLHHEGCIQLSNGQTEQCKLQDYMLLLQELSKTQQKIRLECHLTVKNQEQETTEQLAKQKLFIPFFLLSEAPLSSTETQLQCQLFHEPIKDKVRIKLAICPLLHFIPFANMSLNTNKTRLWA